MDTSEAGATEPSGHTPARLRTRLDPRAWSLGARFGITLVLVALVPLTIVAFLVLRSGEDAVENAELRNARASAEFGAATVREYLGAVSGRADEIATRGDVVDAVTAPPGAGDVALSAVAATSPDLAATLLINADGVVVSASPADLVGRSVADQAWFEEAISGRSSHSDISAGTRPATTSLMVAAPARRPGAAVVGVVALEVRTEAVLYAMHETPLGPGAQTMLVDAEGVIVAARDTRLRGRPLSGDQAAQNAELVAFPGSGAGTQLELDPLAEAIAVRGAGTITDVDLPGRGAQVAAFERVEQAGPTVVVMQPSEVFLAPLRRLGDQVVAGAIGVGLAAVLAAALVALRLSRPVGAITQAAEAIERGDPPDSELLEHYGRTNDDVGRLSRVFLEMARQVAARERKLVEQVRALRVEIDEERRQRAVEEVTDTEFFRDLESRAAEMRRRAKEGS